MAENDIYNNKAKYERFVQDLSELAKRPEERKRVCRQVKTKYFCGNSANLKYFRKLHNKFEAQDLSYIRRLRVFNVLKIACFVAIKDLRDCDREDLDKIMAYANSVLKSPKSKGDFVKDVKHIWKVILPEKDERGRPDEALVPYPVRHLVSKMDKSRFKDREDKISVEEYERYMKSFSGDVRIQAFLSIIYDGLARPQELCYVRIKGVELRDNYAIIRISEHGKEGPGAVLCIDSYPYVAAWFNRHPLRHDPEAFFFLNLSSNKRYRQLKPSAVNKHLREKSNLLGIRKKVTCYSFKRNGITLMRQRGDSDLEIQHRARWSSMKPLRSYDLNNAEDALKIALSKRGLIQEEGSGSVRATSKRCLFCEKVNGISDDFCASCKRPLDRKRIQQEAEARGKLLEQQKGDNLRLAQELKAVKEQLGRINAFMDRLVGENPEVIEFLARRARQNGILEIKRK